MIAVLGQINGSRSCSRDDVISVPRIHVHITLAIVQAVHISEEQCCTHTSATVKTEPMIFISF
jgi:hypothetical protein